jgi:hypothetical protein
MGVSFTMYMVVYVSSATELFSQGELEELLKKARTNNHASGITGMLLYRDGNFMQLLEGPRDAVEATYRKIELDSRHRGIIRLLQREAPEREFSEWSMGFHLVASEKSESSAGYSDFLNRPLESPCFQQDPSKALQLLLSFKKIVR